MRTMLLLNRASNFNNWFILWRCIGYIHKCWQTRSQYPHKNIQNTSAFELFPTDDFLNWRKQDLEISHWFCTRFEWGKENPCFPTRLYRWTFRTMVLSDRTSSIFHGELVCVVLSKNPSLNTQAKRDHIASKLLR